LFRIKQKNMNPKYIFACAAVALGVPIAAHAQNGPAYNTPDLIVAFENPAGIDVEFNLGLASNLPTSGTVDFGNVSSYLTGNGQTVASTFWSVVSDAGGAVKGAPVAPYPLTINTFSGPVSVLPGGLWVTQNNGSTPSAIGDAASFLTVYENSIAAVGSDIATNPRLDATTLGSMGVAVNAASDPLSYTRQGSYQNLSSNLETTGSGTAALWLLTSTVAGTGSGKGATNEGPLASALELGTFNLSANGELTFTAFTAIPEPSTYAAILGALTIGFVAIRRRRAAVI
jgi:hypothetical protein